MEVTALYILLAVFFALTLLALMRVGVLAEYSQSGLFVTALAGFIRIRIVPPPEQSPEKEARKKMKKAAKKKARVKKKEESGKQEEKKGGKMQLLLDILPALLNALGKLKRKLRMDALTVHFTAAGEDAYKTAMGFGYASAGLGMLVPLLENNFKIRRRDITASADFTADKPTVYLKARITFAVWELVYIAGSFGIGLLKATRKENYGKAE